MKTYSAYQEERDGFTDVLETVKTIEKIAASSVHFLKENVGNLDRYVKDIERMLSRMDVPAGRREHPLMRKRAAGPRALLVVTGDRGLVGGLWHAVAAAARVHAAAYRVVLAVGTSGASVLREEGVRPAKSFAAQTGDEDAVTDYVFGEFTKGSVARVDVLYPRFRSLAEQEPALVPFLPFDVAMPLGDGGEVEKPAFIPLYEPGKQRVFEELFQRYVAASFRRIVLEARLSELSARTVAMEHAAEKTRGYIGKLSLRFRKGRRALLTEEQLENFAAHRS